IEEVGRAAERQRAAPGNRDAGIIKAVDRARNVRRRSRGGTKGAYSVRCQKQRSAEAGACAPTAMAATTYRRTVDRGVRRVRNRQRRAAMRIDRAGTDEDRAAEPRAAAAARSAARTACATAEDATARPDPGSPAAAAAAAATLRSESGGAAAAEGAA